MKYNSAGQVISAQVKNGKLESFIGYNANNFAWYNPANGKMELFMYAKNGQFFIRDAFIESATIEKLIVGVDMRSKNYVPNKTGSRYDLNSGYVEINGGAGDFRTQQTNQGYYVFDKNGVPIIELGVFL